MYLSFPDMDTMEEDFLEQTKGLDIDLIVCSDAEAILGIGDQGVGVNTSYTPCIFRLALTRPDYRELEYVISTPHDIAHEVLILSLDRHG
jgi:Malic enzyme, N-terminal domain